MAVKISYIKFYFDQLMIKYCSGTITDDKS